MSEKADHAGVPVHPPLFFLSAVLFGALIDDRVRVLPVFADDRWRWSGVIALALGVALIATGRKVMVARGTNVNPTQPTTLIVGNGPFRFTRNPLYLGVTAVCIGLALLLNTWWSLFLLIPLWLMMHFLVLRREEPYLESNFGENYLQYRRRVRRYL